MKHFELGHENIDYQSLLYQNGDSADLMLYATLFVPETIEIYNCIVLKSSMRTESSRDRLRELVERSNDISLLEESFNLIEIGYLFVNNEQTTDIEDDWIAWKIRECWQGVLANRYPEKNIRVRVCSPNETGSTVGVTFCQQFEIS